MQVSSSVHCERTILFTVPFSQTVRSVKSVSFAMLRAEKAEACQTPQPCVWKIVLLLMLLCYGFQESCRYQESRCRSLNISCHAARTNICPSSMCCRLPVLPIDVAFMQQSSLHRSPVLKKGHTCRCQPVTTVTEPFSSQFPFL